MKSAKLSLFEGVSTTAAERESVGEVLSGAQRSRRTKLLVAMVAVTLLCGSVFAQNNLNEAQGLRPYDTWHGGDLDSVSMTSGGLALRLPLATFPQRGGDLDLSFFITFSNKHWYVKPGRFDSQGHVITAAQWLPMPNTGVQIVSSMDWWLNDCSTIEPQDPNIQGQTLYDWSDSVSSPD